MSKFIVMVSGDIPGTDETFTEEYSGILHETREEARAEFLQAKKDGNWQCCWISVRED